jgi:hypothetical protein
MKDHWHSVAAQLEITFNRVVGCNGGFECGTCVFKQTRLGIVQTAVSYRARDKPRQIPRSWSN